MMTTRCRGEDEGVVRVMFAQGRYFNLEFVVLHRTIPWFLDHVLPPDRSIWASQEI